MYGLSKARRVLELVDLVPGLAETEVRCRLRQGLHLHATGQRLLAFYLTEMADRRLFLSTGHSSAALYAEAELGLDVRRARELITVGRKLLTLPRIDQAYCDQRLGWSKLLLLLPIVAPEHEGAWLKRALGLTVRALALQVKLARPGSAPRKPGDSKGTPEIRFPHSCQLAPVAHRMVELAKQKLAAERGHAVSEAECLTAMAELFLSVEEDGSVPGRKRVAASLYRIVLRPYEQAEGEQAEGEQGQDGRLAVDTELGPVPLTADGEVDEAVVRETAEVLVVADDAGPEASQADGRAPPTPSALRTTIIVRDGSACRACNATHDLCVHHIRYRSHGGPTKAANLLTLCVGCHALVHEDLLVLRGARAGEIEFERPVAAEEGRLPVLSAPVVAAPVVMAATDPRENLVTFDSIPASIDGTWWKSHAHLLRFRLGQGLAFRPGVGHPVDAVANTVKPSPDATAFKGILGQDALVARLGRAAAGSRFFGRCFPHTCFVGPAGTGKTTLARGVSRACGSSLIATSGPLLQDTHGLVCLLASLQEGDALFLDELHAVPQGVLETLYEAMAERRLELTVRTEAQARTVELRLPAFTLLAATTEDGMLSTALRSRFGIFETLGFYDDASMAALASTRARATGFELGPEAANVLAEHARGTPRETLRLVERVLEDLATQGRGTQGGGTQGGGARVGEPAMRAALTRLGYDAQGLGPGEHHYMALLRGSPRPIPLGRLARMLGASVRTLIEHLEPWLFRRGLVEMTARGRQAVSSQAVSSQAVAHGP